VFFKEVVFLPFFTVFPWKRRKRLRLRPVSLRAGSAGRAIPQIFPPPADQFSIPACPGWETAMAISQELLDILACPKCKGDIYLNDTQDGLICDQCKLLYEIRDDIPIMLIDEAKPLD
jgi:uncharacterized protein YbaR (Trm112 family)